MAFTWHDGDRTIRFGRGTAATAQELIGSGYALLTTERAEASAAHLLGAAADVRRVRSGRVDEIAAELLDIGGDLVVAVGGGRVIDVAKAVAAATDRRPAAIPTTLSAAEMTRIHRQALGQEGKGFRRPSVVINDPDLSASQPPAQLAASAANSLSHAIEGPLTPMASPVPSLAAEEARRLIDAAYFLEDEPPGAVQREQLALASLLSGYTIDATGYGLHHVLSQTLVRECDVGHGPANAVMLQHSIAALERRSPGQVDPDGTLAQLAAKLARLAGATRLQDLGVERDALAHCAAAAAKRPQLELTPPRAGEDEILGLYEAAW